jgi:hypothetical protein
MWPRVASQSAPRCGRPSPSRPHPNPAGLAVTWKDKVPGRLVSALKWPLQGSRGERLGRPGRSAKQFDGAAPLPSPLFLYLITAFPPPVSQTPRRWTTEGGVRVGEETLGPGMRCARRTHLFFCLSKKESGHTLRGSGELPPAPSLSFLSFRLTQRTPPSARRVLGLSRAAGGHSDPSPPPPNHTHTSEGTRALQNHVFPFSAGRFFFNNNTPWTPTAVAPRLHPCHPTTPPGRTCPLKWCRPSGQAFPLSHGK